MEQPKLQPQPLPQPPFQITHHHEKALKILFRAYHGNLELTYEELSNAMEVGQKTKAWQCGAWKDLKTNNCLQLQQDQQSNNNKRYKLTDFGLQVAKLFVIPPEELEEYKTPETNDELHQKIKTLLEKNAKAKRYGPKIFDFMLQSHQKNMPLLNKHQMAAHFNTLADSHGFFYGLQALKKMGYVEEDTNGNNSNSDKKRKRDEEDNNSNDGSDSKEESMSTAETDEKKKKNPSEEDIKMMKRMKKNQGGKPLKLSDKAFIVPSK